MPTTTPPAPRGLCELAGAYALRLRAVLQQKPSRATGVDTRMRTRTTLHAREPEWLWQPVAWLVATSTSPVFVLCGSLLLIDPHSDHPLFWWSLPAIVALTNAVSMLCIVRSHRRLPFLDRQAVSRRSTSLSTLTAALLFLCTGFVSGFLPDMVPALFGTQAWPWPLLADALWCMALATTFVLLACPLSGAVHAALGFRMPEPVMRVRESG